LWFDNIANVIVSWHSYCTMANTPAQIVISVLDSQNNQLVRNDSGLSSIAFAKIEQLDLSCTTAPITITPSTFGFSSGCALYAYGSGTADVTIAQASTSTSAILAFPLATSNDAQCVFLGNLGPGAITFTATSGTQPVYVLLLGS
jgi:hypothetical protein